MCSAKRDPTGCVGLGVRSLSQQHVSAFFLPGENGDRASETQAESLLSHRPHARQHPRPPQAASQQRWHTSAYQYIFRKYLSHSTLAHNEFGLFPSPPTVHHRVLRQFPLQTSPIFKFHITDQPRDERIVREAETSLWLELE